MPPVSGVFPFKVIGAAEISLFPLHPAYYRTCLPEVGCLALSKSSINWSDDEDGGEEEAEWF